MAETIGVSLPAAIPGYPWWLCKTTTVLCTTDKCRQEKRGKSERISLCMVSFQSFRLSLYSLLCCHFTSPLAFPGRHNSESPCGHPWLRKVSLMNARMTSCVRQGHTEAPVLRTSLRPQPAPRGMSGKPTS